MHRVERFFVYGLLAASFVWSASRSGIAADSPGGNAGAALGTAPAAALTVTELKVVDAAGKVVARIGGDADGGIIQWFGKTGTGRGELSMTAFGAYMTTLNKDGKSSAYLGTSSDAAVGLIAAFDAAGSRRISLIGGDKGGYANFINAQDQLAVFTGVAADTGGGLVSVATSKSVRVAILAGADDGGYLATWNPDSKQTTFVGTNSAGAGAVVTQSKAGVRSGALGQ